MPTGIYKRPKTLPKWWCDAISKGKKGVKFSDSHREAIRQSRIGTHASVAAKKKMSEIARARATSTEWKQKVSEGTQLAMHRPEVRRRHLKGLRRARAKHGVNFKGGNGQAPVSFVKSLAKVLKPLGYVQEHPVSIYRLDFALIENKIAIECDGPKHKPFKQQEFDRNRDKFLKTRGWKVIRVAHD